MTIYRTEKNATPWSKERLKELLEGRTVEKGPVVVKFTNFKKIDGEATANNRKAKLIFLFEWNIELKFTGERFSGKLLIYVFIPMYLSISETYLYASEYLLSILLT